LHLSPLPFARAPRANGKGGFRQRKALPIKKLFGKWFEKLILRALRAGKINFSNGF
jgi:hypothetical protein